MTTLTNHPLDISGLAQGTFILSPRQLFLAVYQSLMSVQELSLLPRFLPALPSPDLPSTVTVLICLKLAKGEGDWTGTQERAGWTWSGSGSHRPAHISSGRTQSRGHTQGRRGHVIQLCPQEEEEMALVNFSRLHPQVLNRKGQMGGLFLNY